MCVDAVIGQQNMMYYFGISYLSVSLSLSLSFVLQYI